MSVFNVNNPFKMSVRGDLLPSICFKFMVLTIKDVSWLNQFFSFSENTINLENYIRIIYKWKHTSVHPGPCQNLQADLHLDGQYYQGPCHRPRVGGAARSSKMGKHGFHLRRIQNLHALPQKFWMLLPFPLKIPLASSKYFTMGLQE